MTRTEISSAGRENCFVNLTNKQQVAFGISMKNTSEGAEFLVVTESRSADTQNNIVSAFKVG